MENQINKIRYNGTDYLLSADKDVVKELPNLGDGNVIFIGLMDETDKDKPITHSYLTGLLEKDKVNNKVFAPTTLPITVRTKWDYDRVCKTPFVLVPSNHPSVYMVSIPALDFSGCDEDTEDILINFPDGVKSFKLFRFYNWLVRLNVPITYTF